MNIRLYNFKNVNSNEKPEWVISAINSFKNTMLDEKMPFPCHFAKLGLEKSTFRFTYINKDELFEPEEFRTSLIEYLNTYKTIDWPSVLVVFINTKSENNLENHEEIFWNILQYLMDSDDESRPVEIPENPESFKWQFCFNGIPLFISGHSNAYKKRRSRHSASDMMLVIQTTETLKPVAGTSKKSGYIRKIIRERVSKYDAIEVSNLLGSYPNVNSHEWKQFWLPDTNIDKKKCPLRFKQANS